MENKRILNKVVGSFLLMALACLMPLTMVAQTHWQPQSASYEDNMTLTGVIQINGVEQQSLAYEVGAFCGTECRGAVRTVLFPGTQRYVVMLTIFGNLGDQITFKLYNHDQGQELDLVSPDAVTFNSSGYGTLMNPYVLNFTSPVFTISVSANPTAGGSVSGAGTYQSGSNCTLTASPNTGYTFVRWTKNGSQVSTNPTYTFTVTENASYVAVFSLNSYTISASANPSAGGSVNGGGSYDYGSTCTLTATPATGYSFVRWTKNGSQVSTNATYSFTVTESASYVAVFSLNSYTISATANPTAGGTVSGGGSYNYGSNCTLTATPVTSYTFLYWTENGEVVSTEATYSFTVTGDRNLVANFEAEDIIVFDDANVKALCIANWDTNGSGELSYAEAAAVTDLGGAFKENTTITSFEELQYFTGLTRIDNWAFYACSSLTAIEIPNSVTTIGIFAFGYCGLTGSLTIPNSVTAIQDRAFHACSGLTSVEIPNSVTSIIDPFRGCSNLEQIIVSSGNPVYDSRDNCNAIIETNTNTLVSGCKNTVIPNSVTTIGYFAFADCYDLTSVEIPNSVTTIGYGAFYGSGLTSVEIPNSVTTIDVWAFGYCSGLTSVEIPNSVTTIGDNAFYYTNLTTIEIPNSVTSIGVWAFGYCSGLTSVEIPNSVTTIGSSAFCGCYSLTSMIVMADNPPTLGERAFDYVHMDIPIYVPCGSLNAYVNEGWGGFSNFIELCNREITATANPSDGGSITGAGEYEYGSTCTLTAIPNPGYRFANWTENGEVVSSNPTYSFTVTNNRFLVASFVETPFVDLGLPSGRIWANCNVGADAPEDFGDYFAWGETQPKNYYGWGNYQYCHYGEDVGYEPKFTKYCSNPDYGYNGFTDCHWNLLPEDDAATVNWGSDWRMPTTEEWDELFNNTTNTWTTQNGIHGVLFTASNGNTLFLPAAGSRGGSAGIRCSYWSNQNDITNLANCAYEFDYDGSSHVGYYTYSYPPYSCNYLLYRYAGQSVRAVHVRSMYTINVSAYPSDGGTVSGAGIYEKDSICTLTAVANDGYTFTKWTQNGVVVSTDAEYSFTVTSGLEMVAHFSSPSPWTITATANPAEGGAVSVMDGYVFDFENDIVPVSWNTSSDYPWHVESNMQYAGFNGSYYLCSGNNGVNNSNSSISATVNYTSDGIVSFLVGCWGEGSDSRDYDKCRFYIDDVLKFDYGSHQTWEEIIYVVSAGVHTFTWTYKKDDSFDSTGDFFGIDNVVFSYDSNCTLTATPAAGYSFVCWTKNGNQVSTNATYSFTVTENATYVANFSLSFHFITAGTWSTASNWQNGAVPGANDEVFIDASCQLDQDATVFALTVSDGQSLTLQSGKTLIVTNTLTNPSTSGLVIEDGAQLEHASNNVSATVKKYIAGYRTGNDKFRLISNPLTSAINPELESIYHLTRGNYDLYDWLATAPDCLEWRNFKDDSFLMYADGCGYLYAHRTNTYIEFPGTLLPSKYRFVKFVSYDANDTDHPGWNLIGNPFVCNAYLVNENNEPLPYYRMNAAGDGFEFVTSGAAIVPMEGVFYQASENGTVYFIRTDNTSQIPTSWTISVSASPSEGGTVSGDGTYQPGQICTVTATANEGYSFAHWTENGSVISTNANYTFTVNANRTLVANFTYNGGGTHEYVDLGLPSGLLWATCNVGADTPEDYGHYFAWGETQPKDTYNWNTYQYCMGSNNTLTKYCNNSSYGYNGFTDNLTTLLPEDDAATANWGNGWRMPTKEEWQELYQNTTHTWTTQNGVNGRLFTASNGNSLFLPAAGYRHDSSLSNAGSHGYYWSSSLYTGNPGCAWIFYFNSGSYYVDHYYGRNCGQSVRPVRSSGQN